MLSFKCNVCGSTSGRELLTITKPDRFEKALGVDDSDYERKWILCQNCDTAVDCMSDESAEVVEKVASSYYEIDFGGKSELEQRFNFIMNLPEEESDNAQRVDRILTFLSKHASEEDNIDICDIGSGLGVFPSKVTEVSGSYPIENVTITGIEPDPTSFSFSKNLERFPVLNGYFPDVVGEKEFKLITLNKVLEHIQNPVNLMTSVVKHLRINGFAYVEVPCTTNVWLKPPDDNSLGVLHCNLYSIHSLSRILANVGLTTILAERIDEPSGKISVYAFAKKLAQNFQ